VPLHKDSLDFSNRRECSLLLTQGSHIASDSPTFLMWLLSPSVPLIQTSSRTSPVASGWENPVGLFPAALKAIKESFL
jgi:hypothetical protein